MESIKVSALFGPVKAFLGNKHCLGSTCIGICPTNILLQLPERANDPEHAKKICNTLLLRILPVVDLDTVDAAQHAMDEATHAVDEAQHAMDDSDLDP